MNKGSRLAAHMIIKRFNLQDTNNRGKGAENNDQKICGLLTSNITSTYQFCHQ